MMATCSQNLSFSIYTRMENLVNNMQFWVFDWLFFQLWFCIHLLSTESVKSTCVDSNYPSILFFNRGCLVYIFSLRFSGSKFLINLRRQFRVRKIFRTQGFAGFTVFSFCVWNSVLFRKCVTYVAGCSFIKTCLLTGC